MPRIRMTVPVFPYSIDANRVANIFNSTRFEQNIPGLNALCGPIGNIKQQIILFHISRKDRKPQVITN